MSTTDCREDPTLYQSKSYGYRRLGRRNRPSFTQEGLIENYADLYDLKVEQVIPLERMAEKSAQNMIDGIQKSTAIPFEKVLYALGIRFVGETVAKKLARHFKSIDQLMRANFETLIAVDEIGDKIAESVLEFFNDLGNIQLVNRLTSMEFNCKFQRKSYQVNPIN